MKAVAIALLKRPDLNIDIIVNVQGDTPFVEQSPCKILDQFQDPTVHVASLMQELKEQEQIDDPNFVKVAVDRNMNSLMFSRSVIPYPRNKEIPITYYEHIGVYAFRKKALIDFTTWPMTPLEAAEKVDALDISNMEYRCGWWWLIIWE
jgi:3-deoxy-manno-octulosonate cytidylyltransferase (CMP-KDO synthetase)